MTTKRGALFASAERRKQLKAIGNAVVPQIAELIGHAINDVEAAA